MSARVRVGLAGLLLVALGGCVTDALTYTIGRYGRAGSVVVTLNCRDAYEVLDRIDAGTLLVVTNVVNETLVGCFDKGPDMATRQRQVAQLFLTEKTNRPLCTIVGERDLSIVHREFFYRCPDDPAAAPPRVRART